MCRPEQIETDRKWVCSATEEETQGQRSSLAPAPSSLVTHTHTQLIVKSKRIILVPRDTRN